MAMDIIARGLALSSKSQYSSMPSASQNNLGKIVQYTGETNEFFTKGYFYQLVEKDGQYSWERINVQPSGGGELDAYLKSITETVGEEATTYDITDDKGSKTSIAVPLQYDASKIVYSKDTTMNYTIGGLQKGTNIKNWSVEKIIEEIATGGAPTPTYKAVFFGSIPNSASATDITGLTADGILTIGGIERQLNSADQLGTIKLTMDDTNTQGIIISATELNDITFMTMSDIENWIPYTEEFFTFDEESILYRVYVQKNLSVGSFNYVLS